MKIGLRSVVTAHLQTLRNLGDEKASKFDLVVFFGIPLAAAAIVYFFDLTFSNDVFNASISVFAIFSALLFSVQVAMYGVFRADKKATGDAILDEDDRVSAEETRKLLREVNANVSYLILISCFAVTVFLVFFATKLPARIESATLILLYSHFLLTVAMVLKRAHEIFDSEYAKPLRFKELDK